VAAREVGVSEMTMTKKTCAYDTGWIELQDHGEDRRQARGGLLRDCATKLRAASEKQKRRHEQNQLRRPTDPPSADPSDDGSW
jgi:hypothetical protein